MHNRTGSIFILIAALVFYTGAHAFSDHGKNKDKGNNKAKYATINTTQSNTVYDSIKLVLFHYTDNPCSIPGAIRTSDDSCRHPLFKYTNLSNLSDTLINTPDSIQSRTVKAQTTLHAFLQFSEIPSSSPRVKNLKHDQFLMLVETKKEVRKMPWIINMFLKVWYFITNVIGKIIDLIIKPVMKLSPLWKVVLVIIIALLVTGIIIIVSRFSSRFYPSSYNNKENGKLLPENGDPDWLSSAQSHLNNKMYAECISDLYLWLLQSIDSRKMVRKHEWWTNRQLLEIIKVRNKKHYPLAGRIIGIYEQTIYGHRVPESETVEQLMQSVINDKGLKP